jgi:uncharacterized protein (DUF1330 family)
MVTIGRFRPGGEAAYERYAAGVLPILERIGAKPRERLRGVEALAGDAAPDLVAVLEFPGEAAIRSFLSSPEYGALLVHRNDAFTNIQSFLCTPF